MRQRSVEPSAATQLANAMLQSQDAAPLLGPVVQLLNAWDPLNQYVAPAPASLRAVSLVAQHQSGDYGTLLQRTPPTQEGAKVRFCCSCVCCYLVDSNATGDLFLQDTFGAAHLRTVAAAIGEGTIHPVVDMTLGCGAGTAAEPCGSSDVATRVVLNQSHIAVPTTQVAASHGDVVHAGILNTRFVVTTNVAEICALKVVHCQGRTETLPPVDVAVDVHSAGDTKPVLAPTMRFVISSLFVFICVDRAVCGSNS